MKWILLGLVVVLIIGGRGMWLAIEATEKALGAKDGDEQ